jgi:hypothetical protein
MGQASSEARSHQRDDDAVPDIDRPKRPDPRLVNQSILLLPTENVLGGVPGQRVTVGR